METKNCKLVIIPYLATELKKDMWVEYVCFGLDRTTDRALSRIKWVAGRDSYVLSNKQFYSASDLKPMNLYVISDEEVRIGELAYDNESNQVCEITSQDDSSCVYSKILASSENIGFSKDTRHDDSSCHLCVPIEPYELTEIMNKKGSCKIEMKDGTPKLVDNKITFIFN